MNRWIPGYQARVLDADVPTREVGDKSTRLSNCLGSAGRWTLLR